jgi:NAD-dependent SIR2 family protein deacetylase
MTAQPDITFFGEKLTDNFEKCLEEDREQADLLLIIGTSLKVAPVSDLISKSYNAPVKAKYDVFATSAHASFCAPSTSPRLANVLFMTSTFR